jgi:hypothetical protein
MDVLKSIKFKLEKDEFGLYKKLSKEYFISKGFKDNGMGGGYGGLQNQQCIGILVNDSDTDFAITFGNWCDGLVVDLKSVEHFEQIIKLVFDLDL